MDKSKPVYQKLVDQQIAVLRVVSYIIVVFMSLLLLMVYSVFGIKQNLPAIMSLYIIGVFVNIVLLFVHKKAYLTYIILISITFVELSALILATGGILSPIVLVLITLPWFAFYTSRKQGRIWFVICFLAIIVIYRASYFGLPVTNFVAENYRTIFLLIIVLFVLVLTSVYMLLVKQDISNSHKSISFKKKELEEQTERMDNLIMLFNYTDELMCVVNIETMVFVEVNPMFKLLLGYELSELRGESVKKVLKDSSLPTLSALKDGEKTSFDSPVLCKNGEQKIVNWLATVRGGKLYIYGRSSSK
jgi:PAS domain-containing protein